MGEPRDLPDDYKVYAPGFGEVTVGELRASSPAPVGDYLEGTLRMWEEIVLNPSGHPWAKSGHSSVAGEGNRGSGSTNAGRGPRSKSNGASPGAGTNAA